MRIHDVRVQKTRKSRSCFVVVGSNERISSLKIDVILDQNQLTRSNILSQGSHRSGEKHALASYSFEKIHGNAKILRIHTFIQMNSSLKTRHSDSFAISNHQTSSMSGHCGYWKIRNVLVGNRDDVVERRFRERTHTGSQHDTNLWSHILQHITHSLYCSCCDAHFSFKKFGISKIEKRERNFKLKRL